MPDSLARSIVLATRDLYDRLAIEYDRSTGDFARFPGLLAELDRFAARADRTRPLLDLGCGAGRDVEYLAKPGCCVVAADLSLHMLRLTTGRCTGLPAMPVQLSMLDLPFRERVFGGVWACASLLHLPFAELSAALTEIFRVLAPGGTAAISMKAGSGEGWHSGDNLTAHRWFTFVESGEFAWLLDRAGFVHISCTPSGRKNWFVAEADKPEEP